MSIKILLLSVENTLLQTMETVYKQHVEKGFFKIYSPQDAEQNKIYYDIILTEEKYLSLIPIKNVPIIVMSEDNNYTYNDKNIIYIKKPIDWQNLYDLILSAQYTYKIHNSTVSAPQIESYMNNSSYENNNIVLKDSSIQIKMEHTYLGNNFIHHPNEPLQKKNETEKIKENDTEKNHFDKKNDKHMHQLVTKIYNVTEIKNITNLLHHYGEENHISHKIIAQASIILDELIYTIHLLNSELVSKEPKMLITMLNNDGEFHLNLECLLPIENNINNILSIAQDYANTIQSFKRHNSYFINMHWHL
jgi:hypothetical protein